MPGDIFIQINKFINTINKIKLAYRHAERVFCKININLQCQNIKIVLQISNSSIENVLEYLKKPI